VYSAKIDGKPTTFGTSGLLYRSNKVMYDRETETLWRQFTGEPILGPLVDSGIRLDFFPVVITTWEQWFEEHPDTTVLEIETGVYPGSRYFRETDQRAIYNSYFAAPETMFPVPFRDDSLETKEVVLGLGIGDSFKAYPTDVLQRELVINDVVGGTGVVVVGSGSSQVARVYLSDGRKFSALADGASPSGVLTAIADSDGGVWRVLEGSLVSEADPSLELARVPAHMAFWFGWFQFHRDTELYGGGE
jgi:hypothetical protein